MLMGEGEGQLTNRRFKNVVIFSNLKGISVFIVQLRSQL